MRIALFRPLDAAGLLAAVPALRALDAAHPQAQITLIAPRELRALGARLARYLDAFLEFPGFPGLPGECELDAVPGFFERAKHARFDLAIQLHGAGEIANPLMVLMGAEHNAGFYRPGRYCPDAQRYLEWREGEDEVERWLRLAVHLGAASKGAFLEFPLLAGDWAEWRALRLQHYVCLHCTGQPQHFAELGDALAADGWNVVLTGPVRVAQAMRHPAVELASPISPTASLGALAALVAKAGLLIANDRTLTRVGAAMRAPVVIPQADARQTLRAARELLARAA
jgi:ADP-heptose:LPS heptosyltransferase